MRLDHDRVARSETRKQSRVAVPGRKRVAADHQTHAARNDPIVFLHLERLVLALRLLPVSLGGDAPHLVPRIGYGLQPSVLCVRAGGLKRHDEGLSRCVHHRVRDLEAALVDAGEDFQRHADPSFRPGLAPCRLRFRDGCEKGVEIHLRIGHAQGQAVGRALGADSTVGAGKREWKRLVQQRFERRLAGIGRAFAIDLRTRRFGKRAPVAPLGDGLQSLIEQSLMAFKQGMRHGRNLLARQRLAYQLFRRHGAAAWNDQADWSKSTTTLSVTG